MGLIINQTAGEQGPCNVFVQNCSLTYQGGDISFAIPPRVIRSNKARTLAKALDDGLPCLSWAELCNLSRRVWLLGVALVHDMLSANTAAVKMLMRSGLSFLHTPAQDRRLVLVCFVYH